MAHPVDRMGGAPVALGMGATSKRLGWLIGMAAVMVGANTQAQSSPALRMGASAEVEYAFPQAKTLSTTPDGSLSLGLRLPVPEGYVKPDLRLHYASRGGDSVVGMGWGLTIPHVALEMKNGADVIARPATDYVVTDSSNKNYLKELWRAVPGGELVCEDPGGAAGWWDYYCYTNPRTSLRVEIDRQGTNSYASGFVAKDPDTGVTRSFGENAASRIEGNGRGVVWLLTRDTNRFGREARYFYEEADLTGGVESHERLLRAIQVGGNKVIEFVYWERAAKKRMDLSMGVQRRSEHLLKEVRVWDQCTATQVENFSDPNDPQFTVLFNGGASCGNTPLEKVKLEYQGPGAYAGAGSFTHDMDRYTLNYTLKRIQHMSGDETVAYGPVELGYNGDGVELYNASGTSVGEAVGAASQFALPDGFTTATANAFAPWQAYQDFNRDGLPDLVYTKGNANENWPNLTENPSLSGATPHRIYVKERKGDGTFDLAEVYDEPLSKYAGWLWIDPEHATPLWVRNNQQDAFCNSSEVLAGQGYLVPDQDPLDAQNLGTTTISDAFEARGWVDATIGIDVRPFLYVSADAANPLYESGGYQNHCASYYVPSPNEVFEKGTNPVFRSLGFSVRVDRFVDVVRQSIENSYLAAYGVSTMGDFAHLNAKLTDLVDMDGDGYADRVVSGLLVAYDPTAPDADASGLRGPLSAKYNATPKEYYPAIYISRFDPAANEFLPFERREVLSEETSYGDLSPEYLSLLGLELSDNQEPGESAMSRHLAVQQVHAVASTLVSVMGQVFSKTSSTQGQWGQSTGMVALEVAGLALELVTMKFEPNDMNPVAIAGRELSQFQSGLGFGTAVAKAMGVDVPWGKSSVASFVVQHAFGYFGSAISQQDGKNAAAVAVTFTNIAHVVQVGFAAVALVSALISLQVFPIVGAVVALVYAVYALEQPTGSFDVEEGTVEYNDYSKRGTEYEPGYSGTSESETHELLSYVDLTGDGVLDLVVSRFEGGSSNFGVFAGPRDASGAGLQGFEEFPFAEFPGVTSPKFLSSSVTETMFTPYQVGVTSNTETTLGLMDINGDGRVDLVSTTDATRYGPTVYLNTGLGFLPSSEWQVDGEQATAPASCNASSTRVMMGRMRGLSWNESDGSEDGWNVGINVVTQSFQDINRDGLPDLVMRDESGFSHVASGDCTYVTSGTMGATCDNAHPVSPEPVELSCVDAAESSEVWFAMLDGLGLSDPQDGTDEGPSHLTLAAKELYSPRQKAVHYVAYNLGDGFSEYKPMTQAMPAFGGGFHIGETVNGNHDVVPVDAVNGTTNFLTDPDGEGQSHLVAMDFYLPDFVDVSGNHAVYEQYKFGIANADALTSITYPEGGTVAWSYGRKVDAQGEQGSPLWVLASAEFDDGVNFSEFYEAPSRLDYAYTGGKLVDREFLGFEAISEWRWDGETKTQVLQTFAQTDAGGALLPERGTVLCTEVRALAEDDVDQQSMGSKVSCSFETKSFSDSAWDTNTSCYANASAWLVGAEDKLYPLYQRTAATFSTAETTHTAAGDEVLRSFNQTATQVTTFDADGDSMWVMDRMSYTPAPEKLVYLVETETSESTPNVARSVAHGWQVFDSDWVFTKTSETWKNANGSTQQAKAWTYDTAGGTYALLSHTETSGTESRTRTMSNYNAGGLPGRIVEASGATWDYVYYVDFETSPGKLKQATLSNAGDASRPMTGTRAYRYDAMGRPVSYTDEALNTETWAYDALGVLSGHTAPGLPQTTYEHQSLRAIDVARDASTLEETQRIIRHDVLSTGTSDSIEWLDGFMRAYRVGKKLDGTRVTGLDFDGDATLESAVTVDDAVAFATAFGGVHVVRDSRLGAQGQLRCASTSYIGKISGAAETPAAWSTRVRDGAGRALYEEDFLAYQNPTNSQKGVRQSHAYLIQANTAEDLESIHWSYNNLGAHAFSYQDHLLRTVRTRMHDGVETQDIADVSYGYNDWGGLVQTTDGLGYKSIVELNGWNQPTKACRERTLGQASGTSCTGLPSTEYAYDAAGRVVEMTDPETHATTFSYSHCGGLYKTTYPTEAFDLSVSEETTYYDAACRVAAQQGRSGSVTSYEYKPWGAVESVTADAMGPEPLTVEYGYDNLGAPQWVADGEGIRGYTLRNFLGQVEGSYGPLPNGGTGRTEFARNEYDKYGNLVTSTNALGFEVTATHDVMGRALTKSWQTTQCDGASLIAGTLGESTGAVTETYEYDAAGRVTGVTDAEGRYHKTTYDAFGRTKRAYATNLTAPSTHDPNVYTEATYDIVGNVQTRRDPLGNVSLYEYDGWNQLAETSVPLKNGGSGIEYAVTRYAYDDNGNLERVEQPNKVSASSCVSSASTSNPDAYVVTYEYTAQNRVKKTTYPADETGVRHFATVDYDKAGRVVHATDPRGNITTTTYDSLGRVLQVTDAVGVKSRVAYDAAGRVESMWKEDTLNQVFGTTTFEYDWLSRRVMSLAANGTPTIAEYDAAGRMLLTAHFAQPQEGLWEGVKYAYTDAGLVRTASAVTYTDTFTNAMDGEKLTSPYAGTPPTASTVTTLSTAQTCYDALGAVEGVEDADGNLTRATYDARGRLTHSYLADVGSGWEAIVRTYDDANRLLMVTHPMGGSGPALLATSYSYDLAGRVVLENFPQAAHPKGYTYDANSNVCTASDLNGTTPSRTMAYTYDARGLVLARTLSTGGGETHGYDEAGNRVASTDDVCDWTYDYDALNRLEEVTQTFPTVAALSSAMFTTNYAYGNDGMMSGMTYPVAGSFSVGTMQYAYHPTTKRLESIQRNGVDPVVDNLAYDGAGRRIFGVRPSGVEEAISYNAMGRVERREIAEASPGTIVPLDKSYSYSNGGDVLTVTDNLSAMYTQTNSYDARHRLASSASLAWGGSIGYSYNSQNLVEYAAMPSASQDKDLTYNATTGLLATVVKNPSGTPTTYSYTHDSYGNRTATTRNSQSYSYDVANRLRTVGQGAMAHEFFFDASARRTLVNDGDVSTAYIYGAGRMPLAELAIENDVVTGGDYNVYFGEELVRKHDIHTGSGYLYHGNHHDGPSAETDGSLMTLNQREYGPYGEELVRSGAELSTDIGFQGNYKESLSGFSHMGHRHYDPYTFSFTAADPIGLGGGISRYAFVDANPFGAMDRSGLAKETIELEPPPITIIDESEFVAPIVIGAIPVRQDPIRAENMIRNTIDDFVNWSGWDVELFPAAPVPSGGSMSHSEFMEQASRRNIAESIYQSRNPANSEFVQTAATVLAYGQAGASQLYDMFVPETTGDLAVEIASELTGELVGPVVGPLFEARAGMVGTTPVMPRKPAASGMQPRPNTVSPNRAPASAIHPVDTQGSWVRNAPPPPSDKYIKVAAQLARELGASNVAQGTDSIVLFLSDGRVVKLTDHPDVLAENIHVLQQKLGPIIPKTEVGDLRGHRVLYQDVSEGVPIQELPPHLRVVATEDFAAAFRNAAQLRQDGALTLPVDPYIHNAHFDPNTGKLSAWFDPSTSLTELDWVGTAVLRAPEPRLLYDPRNGRINEVNANLAYEGLFAVTPQVDGN